MGQAEAVLENIADRDNNLYRVYFEANPIPEEQRKAGFGGVNRYKDLEGFDNSKLIINTSKRLDILTKQIVVQSKSLDEITILASEKEKLLEAISCHQPVKNEDLTRMASGCGYRTDPFTKARKFHWGMVLLPQGERRYLPQEMVWCSVPTILLQVMEIISLSTTDLGMKVSMLTFSNTM